MLEKRRILYLSVRINNWIFASFLFFLVSLLILCWTPIPHEFVEAVYLLLLIFNLILILSCLVVYALIITVRISDLIFEGKLLLFNTLRLIFSIVLTALGMILKELMVYGF